jgi:hypothetical protein
MRRRLATLAAASVFALALGAAPVAAAGSPLTRVSYHAADLTDKDHLLCGYLFTSGDLIVTFRTADVGTYPDGSPYLPAAHQTLRNVFATNSDGASFRVVGSETYNDLTGHLTWKMMFVAQGGGIADSINIVFRAGRDFAPTLENPFNGALVVHENDSCHYYG